MEDSGTTVFPLFFHDNEMVNELGDIEIHQAMEFGILQLMIKNRIRVSTADQIWTYVVPLDENGEPTISLDRPAFLVNPWTNFRQVCSLKKRCFFIYLKRQTQWENYQPANTLYSSTSIWGADNLTTLPRNQPALVPRQNTQAQLAFLNPRMNLDEFQGQFARASVQTRRENYQPAMATRYSYHPNLGPGHVSDPARMNHDELERLRSASVQTRRENYQPAMATGYSGQPNLGTGHVSDPARMNLDELERLRSASVQTPMENYQPAMATGYSYQPNLGPGHFSGRPNLGTGYFSGRPNLGPGYFSGRPNLGPGYVPDRPNLGPGYVPDRPNLGPGYVPDRRPGYVTHRRPGYVTGRLNLGPGYVSDQADLNAPMKFDESERLQMANLQPQRENYERAMATRYDRPNFGPGHVSGGADLNPQMKPDELQGQSQMANLQTQGENYQTAMATGYSDPPNLGPGHVSGRADLKPDELQGQSQRTNIQTDQSEENYQTAMATGYSDPPNLGPGHVSGGADLNPDELQDQSQRTNIQTDQGENYQTEMATGYSDPPNLGSGHVSGGADLNPEMKPDELQGQSQTASIQTDQREENYQTAMATPYLDRLKFGPGHVSGRADLNPQTKLDELQGQSQMASVQNQRENHQTAPPTEPGDVSDPNLSLDSFPPLEKSVNSRLQTKKKAKPKKNNCEECWNAQKNGVPTPFHHCVNDPVVSESGTRDGRPT